MTTSEELIKQLEARVAQRRQEGKYPTGLEAQLEAEFSAIMEVVHRGDDVLGKATELLIESRTQIAELHRPRNYKSRIPGLSFLHFLIAKIIGRETTAIRTPLHLSLEKQQHALELLIRQIEIQQGTDVRVLNQVSHLMTDRLMMIDVLAQSIVELENKISGTS